SVLRRNNDCIDTRKFTIDVLSSYLSFTISAKIFKSSIVANFCKTCGHLVRKIDCHWHERFSFIDSVTEHKTLVTSTLVQEFTFAFVNPDSDVLRLLAYSDRNAASIS